MSARSESWQIHSFLNKFMELTSCGAKATLSLDFDGESMMMNLQTKLNRDQLPFFEPQLVKRTKPSRIRRRNRRKKERESTVTTGTCDIPTTSSFNDTESEDNPPTVATEAQSLPTQLPINCIRHEDGCQNLIYSYYNNYTAICDSCTLFMDQKQKSTPFPSYLCPCCQRPNGGNSYSLCTECLTDIYEDGWVETGRGAWHLDRDLGRIVCIYLDFNQPKM